MNPLPCAVTGCSAGGIPCFETELCLRHGMAANVDRDQAGLQYSDWPQVVQYVGRWISAQNQVRKAGT